MKEFNLEQEQKMLVLERFKTLNPKSKIHLGEEKEVSVKDLISHVEKDDEFGRKIIQVQMKMLKILSSSA